MRLVLEKSLNSPWIWLSLACMNPDIFRTPSWIELKLDKRHQSNIEIQNCLNRSVPISKMAATHICFPVVSWIGPKLGGRHWGDMEIQNCWNHFVTISKMAAIWKFSVIFSQTVCQIDLIQAMYSTASETFLFVSFRGDNLSRWLYPLSRSTVSLSRWWILRQRDR